MTPPDYATWVTKQQAAEAIGVTTKTVERLVQAGQIQQARWQRDGRGPLLAVYQPDDVARIALERHRGPLPPFLVPPGAEVPANGNGHSGLSAIDPRAISNQESESLVSGDDVLKVLVAAAVRVLSETSQTPTLYVTVRDAAAILGLSQADVHALIHDGDLPHRLTRRGGIRIRRKDLEQL